jgi:hypothetical protein
LPPRPPGGGDRETAIATVPVRVERASPAVEILEPVDPLPPVVDEEPVDEEPIFVPGSTSTSNQFQWDAGSEEDQEDREMKLAQAVLD